MNCHPKFKFEIGDRVKATVKGKIYEGVVKDIYYEVKNPFGKFLELYWILFDENDSELLHTWVHPNNIEKDEEKVVFT